MRNFTSQNFHCDFNQRLIGTFQFASINVAETALTNFFRDAQIFQVDLPLFAQLAPNVLIVLRRFVRSREFVRRMKIVSTQENYAEENDRQQGDGREHDENDQRPGDQLFGDRWNRRQMRLIRKENFSDQKGQIFSHSNLNRSIGEKEIDPRPRGEISTSTITSFVWSFFSVFSVN